jgi:plastocyanin
MRPLQRTQRVTKTSKVTMTAMAACLALAAGCSSSSGGSAGGGNSAPAASASADASGTQQVTIRATNDFRFDPATIHAHVGKLSVTLVDTGSYPHNIASMGTTSKTVSGEPGANSTTLTLTFPRAGTFTFECTFHSSAGMKGTFVIDDRKS